MIVAVQIPYNSGSAISVRVLGFGGSSMLPTWDLPSASPVVRVATYVGNQYPPYRYAENRCRYCGRMRDGNNTCRGCGAPE